MKQVRRISKDVEWFTSSEEEIVRLPPHEKQGVFTESQSSQLSRLFVVPVPTLRVSLVDSFSLSLHYGSAHICLQPTILRLERVQDHLLEFSEQRNSDSVSLVASVFHFRKWSPIASAIFFNFFYF